MCDRLKGTSRTRPIAINTLGLYKWDIPACINQVVVQTIILFLGMAPQVKNKDHYINRESPNKPLVYCHLPGTMAGQAPDTSSLKNNAMNVNISINDVLKSSSGVSREEKTICEATQAFPDKEVCVRNGTLNYYLGRLANYDPQDDIDTTMFKCLQDGDTTVRPIYKSSNGSICNASGIPGKSCTWADGKCSQIPR